MKNYRMRAIDDTYKKLQLLFNFPAQDVYRQGIKQTFDPELSIFMNSDVLIQSVKRCMYFSNITAPKDVNFLRTTKTCLRRFAEDLLTAYKVRQNAFGSEATDYARTVKDTHNPFGMLSMGGTGRQIIDLHINHIMCDTLDTLHNDLGFSKRSAVHLAGLVIREIGLLAIDQQDARYFQYAYVEPQRGRCSSDDVAEIEWEYLMSGWAKTIKNSMGNEYRQRKAWAKLDSQAELVSRDMA